MLFSSPCALAALLLNCVIVQAEEHVLQAAPAVDIKEVEKEFMDELKGVGAEEGRGMRHTDEIEKVLSPLFAALEKDRLGRVGHAAARYALHRLFMQRYSWFVRGLEPRASSVHSSEVNFKLSSAAEWPSFLQEKLSELRGGNGFSMHDIASVAAAMEDLIHHETRNRLTMAYDTHGHLKDSKLRTDAMKEILADYAVLYLSAWDMKNMTSETVIKKEKAKFKMNYWNEHWVPWLNDLLKRHVGQDGVVATKEESFEGLLAIGDEIGKGMHKLNNNDCRELKKAFMAMESRLPGRVRLSDFYNRSRTVKWGFVEKIEYLRMLGALDETNKSNPLVIFTNYMTSMPQCIPVSSLYSMCCPNECEAMMGALEGELVAPGADPDHIARLVSKIGSSTVTAPRNLSASLRGRLQQIADIHGGFVPLHGRLFAQWMHHAFPRECPFPHQAGAWSPLTPDEWMKESGATTTQASDAEMLQHIRPEDHECPPAGCSTLEQGGREGSEEEVLPWDDLEELLHGGAPKRAEEVTALGQSQVGGGVKFNPVVHRDLDVALESSPGVATGEAQAKPRVATEMPDLPKSFPETNDVKSAEPRVATGTAELPKPFPETKDVKKAEFGDATGKAELQKPVPMTTDVKKDLGVGSQPSPRFATGVASGEAELKRLLQETKDVENEVTAQPSGGVLRSFLRAAVVGLIAIAAAVLAKGVSDKEKRKQVAYDGWSSDKFV